VEAKAKRTLVKSAPELWELADDLARMEAWMAGVVGAPGPVPVEVTARYPQRMLAWRCATDGARLAIELEEKGFGTCVSITALDGRVADHGPALERLLDELGSPERRPFTR
jgi:hypothetical protein